MILISIDSRTESFSIFQRWVKVFRFFFSFLLHLLIFSHYFVTYVLNFMRTYDFISAIMINTMICRYILQPLYLYFYHDCKNDERTIYIYPFIIIKLRGNCNIYILPNSRKQAELSCPPLLIHRNLITRYNPQSCK